MAHDGCLKKLDKRCDCIKDDLEELEFARDAINKLKKEILKLRKRLKEEN